MSSFNTHVYATVRVKVIGTNFSNNPQEIAEKVADAVCANPKNWMVPVLGTVQVDHVDHVGQHDIEAVEFADGVFGVLVDEINPATGRVVAEHQFDENVEPIKSRTNAKSELTSITEDLEKALETGSLEAGATQAIDRLKALVGML